MNTDIRRNLTAYFAMTDFGAVHEAYWSERTAWESDSENGPYPVEMPWHAPVRQADHIRIQVKGQDQAIMELIGRVASFGHSGLLAVE